MAFWPYVMTCVGRSRSSQSEAVVYLENGLTYMVMLHHTVTVLFDYAGWTCFMHFMQYSVIFRCLSEVAKDSQRVMRHCLMGKGNKR